MMHYPVFTRLLVHGAWLMLLCLPGMNSRAQEFIFKNYAPSDGLNSSLVYQVLQDHEQFIWLCTNNGVVRFDGYKFQLFGKKEGFNDYGAFRMLLDSSKRLWFIPFNGKVCYYRDGKIHAPDSDMAILAKHEIRWMEEIKKGTFCVSTNNGYFYLIRNNKIINYYNCSYPLPAQHFTMINDSQMATFMMNKPVVLNIYTQQIQSVYEPQALSTRFRYLKLNKQRTLVCSGHDAFFLDKTRDGFKTRSLHLDRKYFNEEIVAMHEDKDGNIWLGNINGLMMLEKKKNFRFNGIVHLPGMVPSSMITDKEGNHWISTLNNGVYFLHSTHAFRIVPEKGLPAPVHFIDEDKYGNILYYEESKYLYRMAHTTHAIKEKTRAPYYYVRSWYKTANYLLMMANNPSSAPWFEQDNPAKSKGWILEDAISLKKNREIWFGIDSTCCYIIRHYKKEYCFKPILVAQALVPLLCDSQDNIWFGSKQGLFKFDGDSLINMGAISAGLRENIADVKMQKNGRVWVATSNNGLFCVNENPLIHYNESYGLPTNNIRHIFVESDKVLWLGTNAGALKLTLSPKGKIISIKTFNSNNCLPSDEVNCLYKKNGLVYVGTQNGLIVVDENKINPLTKNAPVYIMSLNNSLNTYIPGHKISMPHRLNDIQINYTAIHYASRKNISYRYKLLPLENTWKTTRSAQISYSLLPPGQYKFYVSAANAEGIWSDSIASIDFEIQPAFWQTLWFKLLISVILALIIIFGIRLRINHVRKKDLLNKKIIESELTALRSQMNPHFIFNSLNSIQQFVLSHKPEDANYYLSRFARLMRKIISYSGQNTISLQQEIEFLNLYVEMEQLRFEKKFSYQLLINPAIESETIHISPMLIQPIIENAIKYGISLQAKDPKLLININLEEKYLVFRIEDNGPGREFVNAIKKDSGLEHQSMGLKNVNERLQLVGQSKADSILIEDLFDKSGMPTGTRVTLYVPILKELHHD